MSNAIHVFSEIGRLKQVMLHRPGRERRTDRRGDLRSAPQ